MKVVEYTKCIQEPIERQKLLKIVENVLIDDGVLSFEHVQLQSGVKKILDDVSFQIPQGQVSAFVGPSAGLVKVILI